MSLSRLDDRALLDACAEEGVRSTVDRLAQAIDSGGHSLARRDTALLQFHRNCFGPSLAGVGTCPGCGEWVEVELGIDELLSEVDEEVACRVLAAGYEVEFRMPTAGDVRDANGERALGERCVTAACRLSDGLPISAGDLPDEVIAAMAERMELVHPAGNLSLLLSCPACERSWEERPDVAEFVSAYAHGEARRLEYEIHTLAITYGWNEDEILSLPRARRWRYLELILG